LFVSPPRPVSLPGYGFRIAFGGVLSVLGLVWLAVCVGFAFTPKMRDGLPANLAFALVLLLTPGLALYLTGRARRSREDRMLRAAELATAAGRVPVGEVAEQLHVPIDVARQALIDAVGTGRLTGRLDVERGVFTVLDAADVGPSHEVSYQCRGCGAASKAFVAPGEAPRCGYCGASN
jgi:hypothetical protein